MDKIVGRYLVEASHLWGGGGGGVGVLKECVFRKICFWSLMTKQLILFTKASLPVYLLLHQSHQPKVDMENSTE